MGNIITADIDPIQTVEHRIALAKTIHLKLYKILRNLTRKLQRRVLKATVIAVALYGCESWPLQRVKKKLNSLSIYLKNSLNPTDEFKTKLSRHDLDIHRIAEIRKNKYKTKLQTTKIKNHPVNAITKEGIIMDKHNNTIRDTPIADTDTIEILQPGGFYEQGRKYKEWLLEQKQSKQQTPIYQGNNTHPLEVAETLQNMLNTITRS